MAKQKKEDNAVVTELTTTSLNIMGLNITPEIVNLVVETYEMVKQKGKDVTFKDIDAIKNKHYPKQQESSEE